MYEGKEFRLMIEPIAYRDSTAPLFEVVSNTVTCKYIQWQCYVTERVWSVVAGDRYKARFGNLETREQRTTYDHSSPVAITKRWSAIDSIFSSLASNSTAP